MKYPIPELDKVLASKGEYCYVAPIPKDIVSEVIWAYNESAEAGNELINFYDDCRQDAQSIVDELKRFKVQEFTLSMHSTALIDLLAAFDAAGAKLDGMVWINAKNTFWEETKRIPAVKLKID